MKKRILIILCMFISSGIFSQADFRMMIESALIKGEKNISIPMGTYTLMSEDYESVTLKDLKDVSIDANGSTIICKKPSRAFDLINCENVRLSNFSIDYDPLPFTQGRIIEMDEGKNWWIVEIFEGYPTEGITLRMNRMNIYDPETNLYKENMKTFVHGDFEPEIEHLGERKIKLYKSNSDQGYLQHRNGHNEEVGDLFLMLVREENCRSHTIVLDNSKWCKLDNVTIYTAPMFGIVENECEATHYYQCVITKNLYDPKVGYPRLRSAGGDAFHSKCAYRGPVVEECTFEYQGDDCINIGTRFHIVMKAEGSSVYILSTSNSTYIEPGNRLQVISSEGQLKGETVVESIEPVSGFAEQELKKATDMFRLRSVPKFVIRLDLEESLPFSRGDIVCSLDKAGDGFILKNNKFGYTRARGALLKGTGGRVINNTFEGSMLAGITVIPEFYWMEGTFARDLVISGNTFRNCHYGVSVPGSSQFKTGTKDCFFDEVERMGPDRFRLYFAANQRLDSETHPAVVGDWIAFRGRLETDIALNECSEMFIDGVTIQSGGGFCIHETGGEGGNKYTYKVTYAPTPAGADKRPLMACNADAFHSRNMRKGPILENCLFEGMQDDGIPIHGSFALVAEENGNQLTVCGGKNLRIGDPVCFYDTNGSYAGEARITSIAPKQEFTPKSPITNHRFKRNKDFIQVTIDKNLELGFQYLISNPAANGSGYIIRNNIIRNHRARGMLLKAENGIVEGNIIEGSTIGGIILSPEIWWNEAGFSRNIIIRNNIIRHTGYSTVGSSDHQSGALTISGGGGEPDQIVPVYQDPKVAGLRPGHRNILIENNTIEDCEGVNMMIAVAENVLVKNNKFIRPQQGLSHRGQPSGVDPTALIWVFNSENVHFEGNTVRDLGSFNKTLIKVNDKSKKISGIRDGVTPGLMPE